MSTALRAVENTITQLEDSPAYRFMEELSNIQDEEHPSKVQGVALFEKWVKWMSTCDTKYDSLGFGASTTTIFSVAYILADKGTITPDEKATMYNKAINVIQKHEVDSDTRDFIAARLKEIKH